MKYIKKYEVNVLLGDFKGKLSSKMTADIADGHGLGVRYEQGVDCLIFPKKKI